MTDHSRATCFLKRTRMEESHNIAIATLTSAKQKNGSPTEKRPPVNNLLMAVKRLFPGRMCHQRIDWLGVAILKENTVDL